MTDEDETEDQALQPRLHSVMIGSGAAAIGKAPSEVDLASLNVEVTAVRRRNVRTVMPVADTRIEEGDVLVLLGAGRTSRPRK